MFIEWVIDYIFLDVWEKCDFFLSIYNIDSKVLLLYIPAYITMYMYITICMYVILEACFGISWLIQGKDASPR